jgi:hypothetical protein
MPSLCSHSLILVSKTRTSPPLNIFIFISNAPVAIWLWSNQNWAGIVNDIMAGSRGCRPTIKNDSSALPGTAQTAAHRKLDRRRDDLCEAGVRKCVQNAQRLAPALWF